MKLSKITFKNDEEQTLTARLELPADRRPGFVIQEPVLRVSQLRMSNCAV